MAYGAPAPPGMKLALFDLDHTLIPFDSGMAWTRFLVARGVLPPDAERVYLAHCQQYVAGTLDIRAMHRASMLPLACFPHASLMQWADEFEAQMASQVPLAMRTLVRSHQDAGDLCVIVTATTRLIAEPFARLFGVAHVVATEAAMAQGAFTGEILGEPCYREHKVSRVDQWLAQQGLDRAVSSSRGSIRIRPVTCLCCAPCRTRWPCSLTRNCARMRCEPGGRFSIGRERAQVNVTRDLSSDPSAAPPAREGTLMN